ncbi:MAG TPA: MaoC family dehydratase, partial [Microthrixaceae bacterium]|nr:MaoC family dehydratase [Microthrixaceae bacterium]
MSVLVVPTPADLLDHVGESLEPTDWIEIDQARIDRFADATGDHQWIHVDPERAASGPFGATIAHGFLTLSLANLFLPDLLVVEQTSMGVNVGVEKVRFP